MLPRSPSRPTHRWTRSGGPPLPERPDRSGSRFTPSPVYRRRRPEETPLYQVVQHHLETYLAMAEAEEVARLPPWAEHEFRRYLTCGILAFGFARARCNDCRQERFVAFSCKGRCVCPSCTNRRMAEVAAHLSDGVVPVVPMRQWVLSVPKRLRPHLMGDAELASAVLRILLRAVRSELRASVRGPLPEDARLGAVSFLHRFGSALNPHPHFHLAVTDGLFAREHDDEAVPLRFRPAADLNAERARALSPIVQQRILRLYVRRGLLLEADAADMLTWRGTGGFSLDGSVRIAAHDRAGLERLLRYCARPPFALHRLRPEPSKRSLSSPDARLVYELPRPARDGRTRIRLSPFELLDRLARLIPPRRVHRHRYHGVFAPNAKWRREGTRYGRDEVDELDPGSRPDLDRPVPDAPCAHGVDRGPRRRWAQLLARVYEVHPLRCPSCHGEMRILAFLTDPAVVRPILRHLRIPEHPPPVAPARAPPQTELLTLDPPSPWDTASDAAPGSDPFDQSLPGDDGTWSA